MAVTSYEPVRPPTRPDVQNGKEPHLGDAPPPRWATVELGIVLVALGLPFWIIGARFTVDGIRIGANLFLSWLTIPYQLPAFPWFVLLGLIVGIGGLASRVEVKSFPFRLSRRNGRRVILFIGAAGLIGWAATSGIDLATTGLGVVTLGLNPWPIHRWVAATPWALVVYSTVQTFLPEWLLMAGYWMIAARWRR